jgi:hypothetical protein
MKGGVVLMEKLSPREQLLFDEIKSISDGFDTPQHAITALMEATLLVGCKYKDSTGDNITCIECPVTSYLCRNMRERSTLLMEENEDESKAIEKVL